MVGETHIAHATATFSELGIAAGIVWLSDVVRFRSELSSQLVIAKESLRIITEDYHAKACGFNGSISSAIRKWMVVRERTYTLLIKFLLGLLRWSPFFCVGLGICALFGISYFPTSPEFFPSFLSYSQEAGNHVYFIMSFLSFSVIGIPLIADAAKRVINWYALKDIKIA